MRFVSQKPLLFPSGGGTGGQEPMSKEVGKSTGGGRRVEGGKMDSQGDGN